MASPMENAKPACGGGVPQGEYDLGIHVLGLFLVLIFSIVGCGFPVMAKKTSWMKIPEKIFFICKNFGTGVLIATAFVHLIPTAFISLSDPCLPDILVEDYPPMPGVIMMGSMFILFVIEMYLNAKTGGHSHGGPTGKPAPAPDALQTAPYRPRQSSTISFPDVESEKEMARRMYEEGLERQGRPSGGGDAQSDMPAWFVVFYEQYVRQRLEMLNMIYKSQGAQVNPDSLTEPQSYVSGFKSEETLVTEVEVDPESQAVDPAVYKKLSANITLLEGGILFHSVFVGMTVSLTNDGFIVLLIAILFHQMFEGLGLGSRIADVPYPKRSIRPWVLVVAFGTTAPIGQAIGILARGSYDPDSAFGLIIVGIFNAISSGLLLYAALVDLLYEDFLSEEAQRVMTKSLKIQAFCWVLAGAAGMSVVGIWA